MKTDEDVRKALEQARDSGHIKESTCTNACSWLKLSFAGVVIDGVRVGDFIGNLVETKQWQELNDGFF